MRIDAAIAVAICMSAPAMARAIETPDPKTAQPPALKGSPDSSSPGGPAEPRVGAVEADAGGLGALLDAVIKDSRDIRARSRLEAATRRLREERLASLERDRREALEGYGSELERARLQAAGWNARLEEARRYRDSGRWLLATDRILAVLRDNPKHGDALAELNEARRMIAHRLDVGGLGNLKTRHLYSAFFHYLQKERQKSLDELRRALESTEAEAELPDADIQRYIAELFFAGPMPIDGSRGAPAPAPALSSAPDRAPKTAPAPAAAAAVKKAEAPKKAAIAPPRRKIVEVEGFVERRADSLFLAAKTYRKAGKLEEAQRTLDELLELEPDYPNAREAAFEVQERIRTRILESKSEAEAHYGAGLAHYGAGRLEEARAELERAIAADPDHPHAREALERLKRELAERQP